MIYSELRGMNVRYFLEEMMGKYCKRDKTYVHEDFLCENCDACKQEAK